jgi:RNA dependent RNA polymerase
VNHRLQVIKMRLRESQRKFRVHDVDEAEFKIARSFDYLNLVHLSRFVVMSFLVNTNLFSRPVVMAFEDRGVDKNIFKKKPRRPSTFPVTCWKNSRIFSRNTI